MWIFIGVIVAFAVWFFLKLSIISLYALFFAGIVLGAMPYLVRKNKDRRE